ncbi:hypothetical protein [Kribbella deserti]|uniref:PH domain-containing protein n=1 Tax=Kribbella deserti TaxID=1926257 RepID=A0ABV6QXS9_9ACTN
MSSSTYRMRPDRFLGIPAVGLIILGVAAVLWAFNAPDSLVTVLAVLGGLVTLTGLWVLVRPPVLLKLGKEWVEVRGLRTNWMDIKTVELVATTQGDAVALRTKRPDDTTLIPLRWLPPARQEPLQIELRDRLNSAHGYTIWDGRAE